jgi:methylmalonyl-CoA mutase, N-terminal domain
MPSERKDQFQTVSSRPIEPLYTADSIPNDDYAAELGDPGTFPFTRGIHATGYRTKLWTMRQFAGFGAPADTKERYRGLLEAGATGLSVAFDLPSLMGLDADHPLATGEVGKCGVNITSLADMETLFDGIPLGDITTSMTINAPAAMMFAMYLVLAERRGISWGTLSGTIQNDILKEFIAQKEYIFPPRPSMRLITDVFAFCAAHVPRWNTISVSGYHIREAGATAVQELAFTLRDGVEYVQAGVDAGMAVDQFVPRMSFFFDVHSDFFEEIAKFRAARRIWARVMRDRFGAADPRSMKLRTHAQTAGVSLTAQQPMNNVVRTALQALSAVLGGTNSLHTCSLDEALALPSAEAATLALRTQQILAFETGITKTVDPFGGSYFVERLTRDLEEETRVHFDRIDAMGGMIAAIERGYPQREIAESAYRFQQDVERGHRRIVGVNECVSGGETTVPILQVDETVERDQIASVDRLRRTRNSVTVRRALERLRRAAAGTENTMPPILDAVRAYATVGEMCDVLRGVWGEYLEEATI